MSAGRYAPSPSGDLHLGNLRTALLAWFFAVSTDRVLLLRYEDLDVGRTVAGSEQRQSADLEALGVRFNGEPLRQSQRQHLYDDAVAHLRSSSLVYECFCTRREIQEAPRAPHAPPGAYPGTCRSLSRADRQRQRRHRPPALRLKAATSDYRVRDLLLGEIAGPVDDVVLMRNDGAAAYNLAVVVDDYLTGVDQVVRGDDLASSAPRQSYLRELLYGPESAEELNYVHVPLVLNTQGKRLAKRDGAVTLDQLRHRGWDPLQVRDLLLDSLGLPPGPLEQVMGEFEPAALPCEPWVFSLPAEPGRLDAGGRASE